MERHRDYTAAAQKGRKGRKRRPTAANERAHYAKAQTRLAEKRWGDTKQTDLELWLPLSLALSPHHIVSSRSMERILPFAVPHECVSENVKYGIRISEEVDNRIATRACNAMSIVGREKEIIVRKQKNQPPESPLSVPLFRSLWIKFMFRWGRRGRREGDWLHETVAVR